MSTERAGEPLAAGGQHHAVVEAAGRLFSHAPELAAMLAADSLRHVTLGELVDAANALPRGPHMLNGRSMRSRLSDREIDVVRLIVEGLSNKEISRRLELSDKTVKNHISHILAKLGLTARTQVAVLALRGGVA